MCDDGYDGEDCSTVTDTENIILYIIDGFEDIHVNRKLWIHVTGAVIKNTCPFEPYSKSMKCLCVMIYQLIYCCIINIVCNRRNIFTLQW